MKNVTSGPRFSRTLRSKEKGVQEHNEKMNYFKLL